MTTNTCDSVSLTSTQILADKTLTEKEIYVDKNKCILISPEADTSNLVLRYHPQGDNGKTVEYKVQIKVDDNMVTNLNDSKNK